MSKEIAGLKRVRDVERIVLTLNDAFSDYPKLIKAFPDEKIRSKVAEIDFRFYGNYDMRCGGAYSISQEGHGIAIVTKSGKRKASKLNFLLAGCYSKRYRELLAELTEDEQQKRNVVLEEINKMAYEIEFPRKYLYISFLGVRKQYQGQGLGTMILESIIEEGKQKSLPIVFYTSDPQNVDFYQRLGFKVMGITSSKEFEFINIYLIKP